MLAAGVLGFAALFTAYLARFANKAARGYLHFAAALNAALAGAILLPAFILRQEFLLVADGAAALVIGLAPASLALAMLARFEHKPGRLPSSLALLAACLSGLAGAATGEADLVYLPFFASIVLIVATAARSLFTEPVTVAQVFASGAAFAAAVASFATPGIHGLEGLAVFSAAGLIGTSGACIKRQAVKSRPAAPARTRVSR